MSLSLATKGVINGRLETKGVIWLISFVPVIPTVLREVIRLNSVITVTLNLESYLDGNN